MEVMVTKVVVLLMLGVIKLVFGLAPLALARAIKKQKNDWWIKKFIGAVLCIGGGVLLSTVFIHMLKEVRESMEKATEMGMLPMEADYPFAELIMCTGFLLILLVESIVHKFFGGHGHGDNLTGQNEAELSVKIPRVTRTHLAQDNLAFQEDTVRNQPLKAFNKQKTSKESMTIVSSLRGFLVLLALSVHSLFEGMAVGLEETSAGVWQLFLAIAIHSTAIVFCIGTEMVSNKTRKVKLILSMVVLSAVTPLGVLIGLVLSLHGQTETGAHVLLVGVLQGVAGGTLLYITFFEVLSRDKLARYGMSGMMGALVIMLGFTIMAALNGAAGHSHGGGKHHEHGNMHHDVANHENYDQNFNQHSKMKNVKGERKLYDHFHEEYDLDHGDHRHHIGPYHAHANNSVEFDDEFLLDVVIFDTEDYENEDSDPDSHKKEDDHYHTLNKVPELEHAVVKPHHHTEQLEQDHDIHHHHQQQESVHDSHNFPDEHYSEDHRHTNQSDKHGIINFENVHIHRQENETVTDEHKYENRAGHHDHQHVKDGN